MSGLLVPASLASARRVSIIRTHPLIEPVLQLLRAHVVHLMVLYVLVGHRVDLLVGVAGRLTTEVVLARRRHARSRRRLHPAAPNLAGRTAAAAIRLAEPAAHHARRVVLVLEVGVAVADNTAARITAVEVRVVLLELEVALLSLLERRGRVGVVRARLAILDVGRVVVLRRLLLRHAQPSPRRCASQPRRRRQHEGASRGEHQQSSPHHR